MSAPAADVAAPSRAAKLVAAACAASVLMLWLDWPQFSFAQLSAGIVPWQWLLPPTALAVIVAVPALRHEPRVLLLAAGALVYLAVNALAVGASADAAASEQELVNRVLGVGVLACSAVLTVIARRGLVFGRWVLAASCAAAALLACDLVTGTTWSTTLGRAAGTYTNPNVAAAMVLLLGLGAVRTLPPSWREPFWLAVGLTSVLAFSRAGYLLLAVATVHLARTEGIRWRRTAATVVVAAVAALAVGPTILESVAERNGNAALARQVGLSTLLRIEEGDASSTSERLQVAEAAIDVFSAHPLLGAGLTATTRWSLPVSTHNQFLRTAAELGLVGVAALLLLLASVFASSRAWGHPSAVDFGLWLGVVLLFSHNVLDNWAMLAAIGAFAGGGFRPPAPSPSRDPVLR